MPPHRHVVPWVCMLTILLPYCGQTALVLCVELTDTCGSSTCGRPVLGTTDDTNMRLPASPRGAGKAGKRHLTSKAVIFFFKYKNVIKTSEIDSCWTNFMRLMWKPDVSLLILSEIRISSNQTFYISYPEHCLPLGVWQINVYY